MKDFITKLFSESSGISSMRVMGMISLLIGGALAFYGMTKSNIDYSGLSLLVGTFVISSFGGKVLQKREELNGAKSNVELDSK